MTGPACEVCNKPAPQGPAEFKAGRWFHLGPDGAGRLPAVWICGDHGDDPAAVMRAIMGGLHRCPGTAAAGRSA